MIKKSRRPKEYRFLGALHKLERIKDLPDPFYFFGWEIEYKGGKNLFFSSGERRLKISLEEIFSAGKTTRKLGNLLISGRNGFEYKVVDIGYAKDWISLYYKTEEK